MRSVRRQASWQRSRRLSMICLTGGSSRWRWISAVELLAMKCATVYLFKRDLILHAMSKTTDGVWILNEPCERFAADVAEDMLGAAAKAALQRSRSEVPHPTDFRAVTEPLLRAAGVKSWNTFAKSARCVELEESEPGVLELIPTENKGADDGFVPRAANQIVRGPSDAELGKGRESGLVVGNLARLFRSAPCDRSLRRCSRISRGANPSRLQMRTARMRKAAAFHASPRSASWARESIASHVLESESLDRTRRARLCDRSRLWMHAG